MMNRSKIYAKRAAPQLIATCYHNITARAQKQEFMFGYESAGNMACMFSGERTLMSAREGERER